MPIIFKRSIDRNTVRKNGDVLYLFEDNIERVGIDGWAKELRGEVNASGIRVQKRAGKQVRSQLSDKYYLSNIQMIAADFAQAIDYLERGRTVVMPLSRFGSKTTSCITAAPDTYKFVECMVDMLVDKYGDGSGDNNKESDTA